jgi:hypothetical protein
MMVSDGKKTHRWNWVTIVIVVGFHCLIAAAVLLSAAAFLLEDQHRTIIRRMGWKCVSVQDTKYAQYPHVEVAAFWFRDNPHFEERASGPKLCADLQASGVPDVEMTFDTWGNRFWGFHGYDTTKLTANGKEIVIYDSSSGEFHDDEPHFGSFSSAEDKKQHPAKYKFPIDTFTP